MKHPPYHLRMNKAVDRFLLIETLQRLKKTVDLSGYTYYGFGGPFLEDCRLINTYFPEISIVSLETNSHTYKRQQFHLFSKNVKLVKENFQNFVGTYEATGKEIFWIDYTDMSLARINEFRRLLGKCLDGSIVRITVNAAVPYDVINAENIKDFHDRYNDFLPADVPDKDFRAKEYPFLLQKMFRMAAEKALPAGCGFRYVPLSSSYYNDQTMMYSLTGIVTKEVASNIPKLFKSWKFNKLQWDPPDEIDVPVLSVKERLTLESLLPLKVNTGKSLARALGYRIGDNDKSNLAMFQQYAYFHNCYPYFAKLTL